MAGWRFNDYSQRNWGGAQIPAAALPDAAHFLGSNARTRGIRTCAAIVRGCAIGGIYQS
jgi:hypothetical protein